MEIKTLTLDMHFHEKILPLGSKKKMNGNKKRVVVDVIALCLSIRLTGRYSPTEYPKQFSNSFKTMVSDSKGGT
jgi:hypothetical protein